MAKPIIAGIYQIIHKESGKMYVGQAKNIERRFSYHKSELRGNRHRNKRLQNSWNKYGEESFEFLVLEIVTDYSTITVREQYWLDELNAVEKGFNICHIAESHIGVKHTEETKEKLRRIMLEIGHKVPIYGLIKAAELKKINGMSEETKLKISSSMKGRVVSDSTRKKIGDANRGRRFPPMPEQTRRKISLSIQGKKKGPITDEHRYKLSAAKKGKTLTAEHVKKIAEGKKKKRIEKIILIFNELMNIKMNGTVNI